MKVKNVSKKIIGNSQFRLLPGDTMLVTGKEAWVKNYLSEESIVEVKESAPESVESGEKKQNPSRIRRYLHAAGPERSLPIRHDRTGHHGGYAGAQNDSAGI